MAGEPLSTYEFGPFRVEPRERQLRRSGTPIPLTPKAFDTLLALIENAGRAISKNELLERVWPGTSVAEATLAQNIFALRKALGDVEYIETVPKFGYRFATGVRELHRGAGKLVLVVLPFENLSGDPDQEYFSDGLTDEMIAQLSRVNPKQLGVIARTSAMKYKSTRKTVAEIGRELGASYVVEGSVRRSGQRVRVTAQLIETAGQTHVWSQTYERNFEDLLVLQNDVAQSIAGEINVTLSPGAVKRMASAHVFSTQAHEAYLRGRYFWNKRTEDGLQKGLEYFRQAIDYEPRYAAAYDGVSDSYVMLACRGVLPAKETFQRAREAAMKALEIDGGLGEAYATLAHVRLHDWDWTNLDDEFQRALELNPGHAFAYYWYGEYLMAMGRAEESIAIVTRAHEVDPLSSVLSASLGMILYLGRRYDEAIGYLGTALDLDADHFLLHFRLGLVYLQKQMWPAAIGEMQRAVALSGRSTETLTGLAQAYAAAGLLAEMRATVDEIERESARRYVSPYNMSRVYAAAGDADQSFAWLERAYQERNPDLIELRSEPAFDPMRPDPRFSALLRRVGWRNDPI
jgi:TolB-like protein/DNA-binding winged helix-turn-helix (wHTH) protein